MVERSLAELGSSARLLSLVGGTDAVLVLRLGGAHADKRTAARRFIETLRPEQEVLRYLALENDERIWTVAEVVDVASSLNVPAITDTLHHGLNPGGQTLKKALDLSLPTWKPRGARPKVHLSSQDPEKQIGAHAYSVDLGDWHALLAALDGRDTDVMVEAKGKEHALAPLGLRSGNIRSERRLREGAGCTKTRARGRSRPFSKKRAPSRSSGSRTGRNGRATR